MDSRLVGKENELTDGSGVVPGCSHTYLKGKSIGEGVLGPILLMRKPRQRPIICSDPRKPNPNIDLLVFNATWGKVLKYTSSEDRAQTGENMSTLRGGGGQ